MLKGENTQIIGEVLILPTAEDITSYMFRQKEENPVKKIKGQLFLAIQYRTWFAA